MKTNGSVRKGFRQRKKQTLSEQLEFAQLQAQIATDAYSNCRKLQHAILQTLKFDMEVFSSGAIVY